ncbi:hypothetical protein, partial [Shewanella chilikensis]|uniref:hypothetical protein n=1 Tax=Shewanella chilikensis TaxID=558541 RepID=UPI003007D4F6
VKRFYSLSVVSKTIGADHIVLMIYREKHIAIMTDNAQSWRDTPISPSVSPKAAGTAASMAFCPK